MTLLENIVLIAIWWGGLSLTSASYAALAGISLITAIVLSLIIVFTGSERAVQPMRAIWQAIVHLSPGEQSVAAPKTDELKLGRELVNNLIGQLNQLVNVAQKVAAETQAEGHDLNRNFIAQNLPLPMLVLDSSETITFANGAAAQYIGIAADQLKGKNVYMVLDMAFPSKDTFDTWLKAAKAKNATAAKTWERVRLGVRDAHPARLFDLAAYYNRGNPDKIETILTLFDHTKQYSQDDQAVSFIALTRPRTTHAANATTRLYRGL